MQKRIFSDKWSHSMKQLIANMTDEEYDDWAKDIGATSESSANNKSALDGSLVISDKDIENWAKQGNTN